MDLNLALLHDKMVDKNGDLVTTSVTFIDIHDIARSCKTFGVNSFFISHPSPNMQGLVRTLKEHWNDGFGAAYNPNRKDALQLISIVSDLDHAIEQIDLRTGKLPKIIVTSARPGPNRIGFADMAKKITLNENPYLILFGTGWGMSEELLGRADYFLEPINGPNDYNHLSVRSACAICLDRLVNSFPV